MKNLFVVICFAVVAEGVWADEVFYQDSIYVRHYDGGRWRQNEVVLRYDIEGDSFVFCSEYGDIRYAFVINREEADQIIRLIDTHETLIADTMLKREGGAVQEIANLNVRKFVWRLGLGEWHAARNILLSFAFHRRYRDSLWVKVPETTCLIDKHTKLSRVTILFTAGMANKLRESLLSTSVSAFLKAHQGKPKVPEPVP